MFPNGTTSQFTSHPATHKQVRTTHSNRFNVTPNRRNHLPHHHQLLSLWSSNFDRSPSARQPTCSNQSHLPPPPLHTQHWQMKSTLPATIPLWLHSLSTSIESLRTLLLLLLLSFHPVREKCTPFIHRWGDPFVSVPAGIHNPGTSWLGETITHFRTWTILSKYNHHIHDPLSRSAQPTNQPVSHSTSLATVQHRRPYPKLCTALIPRFDWRSCKNETINFRNRRSFSRVWCRWLGGYGFGNSEAWTLAFIRSTKRYLFIAVY